MPPTKKTPTKKTPVKTPAKKAAKKTPAKKVAKSPAMKGSPRAAQVEKILGVNAVMGPKGRKILFSGQTYKNAVRNGEMKAVTGHPVEAKRPVGRPASAKKAKPAKKAKSPKSPKSKASSRSDSSRYSNASGRRYSSDY